MLPAPWPSTQGRGLKYLSGVGFRPGPPAETDAGGASLVPGPPGFWNVLFGETY